MTDPIGQKGVTPLITRSPVMSTRLTGQPDDGVAGGVGGTEVDQLGLHVAHMEGQPVAVGDLGQGEGELAPLHLGPEPRQMEARFRHLAAGPLVADDQGLGEEEVAEGVVPVGVGADQDPRRRRADAERRRPQRAGAGLGRRRVHQGGVPPGHHQRRVVQAPPAVRLHIGEDAVGHLGEPARRPFPPYLGHRAS
ncbi:hypothetical protein SMD11_1165 [Streptomyces albireticuli]|uniref:Uncharacterized protein n=1 Tax=Streptomyces albireticuli TaxID=1940 RepID=A0A1Z2KXR7_9ACTN|nr:hypothetical protein SMD11_1165 [Streptomyces albireticuli]